MSITVELVAAIIVGILSVARTARLIGFDEYPPMKWLRHKWDAKTSDEWQPLLGCPFCSAPYLATGMALWAWLAFDFGGDTAQTIWWVVNGVWGLSYLASILVAYDQPPED